MVCMTREGGVHIGSSLGKILDVEVPNDGVGWGQFLRIRVEIQLHKTLARGRLVKVNGRQVWTTLRYEKLPRICFNCGWLVHGEGGCGLGSRLREERGEDFAQFGSWLRAEMAQKGRYNGYRARSGSEGKEKIWRKDVGMETEKKNEGFRCEEFGVEEENITKEGECEEQGAKMKMREKGEGEVRWNRVRVLAR